ARLRSQKPGFSYGSRVGAAGWLESRLEPVFAFGPAPAGTPTNHRVIPGSRITSPATLTDPADSLAAGTRPAGRTGLARRAPSAAQSILYDPTGAPRSVRHQLCIRLKRKVLPPGASGSCRSD